MKIKQTKKYAIALALCMGVLVGSYFSYKSSEHSRDLKWEYYCDSIFITDPDYYNDVLVETDTFKQYIEEHGQWWDE